MGSTLLSMGSLLVISATDEVRFITACEVVHCVNALIVSLKSEVSHRRTQTPNLERFAMALGYTIVHCSPTHFFCYLDSPIERCRRESIGILGVENELHDVVGVPFEHLNALPVLVPIPQLNNHIIRAGDKIGLSRMNGEAANVIWCVTLKSGP